MRKCHASGHPSDWPNVSFAQKGSTHVAVQQRPFLSTLFCQTSVIPAERAPNMTRQWWSQKPVLELNSATVVHGKEHGSRHVFSLRFT